MVGWGNRIWDSPKRSAVIRQDPGLPDLGPEVEGTEFTLISEDGDEGFPGKIKGTVIYTKSKQPDGSIILVIDYEAILLSGADETVTSMTNHSYEI
jgi:aldose 1-epimerase